tara:strand:+ start:262 stop:822 length:561 start_codon:yes stop_codon:yes gene_type:complete
MYKIIDNFINESEFIELKKWCLNQKFLKIKNDRNSAWDNILTKDSGIDIYKPMYVDIIDNCDETIIQNYEKKISKIIKELKWTHHNLYSRIHKFGYGSGILIHNDKSEKSYTDRVAATLYLNDNWNPNSGGELIIYNNKKEPKDIILPKRNRLCVVYDELHKVSVNLNKYVDRLSIQTFAHCKMGK